MLRLIEDELKKISKGKLGITWILTLAAVFFVTGIIVMGIGTEGKIVSILQQNGLFDANESATADKWFGWPMVAATFGSLFTKAAFLIFEGALISKIIIDEFKNKTIHQLFSYPVKKTRLLWSKVILVIVLSLLFQVTAHIAMVGSIKLLAIYTGYAYVITLDVLVKILIGSLGACFIGLIPMAVGLIKYSTIATLLTSLGVVVVICNAFPGTLAGNLMNSTPFMMILGVIGFVVAALTIINITNKDVLAK